MAVCTNCEHPISLHGREGCQARYLVSDPACACTWHNLATALHSGDRPRQCGALVHRDGLTKRCQIMVTESTIHTADHRNGDHCWTEAAAVYPTDAGYLPGVQEPASERQVGGEHYRKFGIQPWDIVDEYELSYYAGNALKYLLRAGHKGAALEDLKKCRHYLDKLIELEEGRDA